MCLAWRGPNPNGEVRYCAETDGSLRHDCSETATTYTITAKGDGGTTSEVFHLLTRLSA